MENWQEELTKKIIKILHQYANPHENVVGRYEPAVFSSAFESIANEIKNYLIKEYGFSYVHPDTFEKLNTLESRNETLAKMIDEKNGKLKQEWSETHDRYNDSKTSRNLKDKHYARGYMAGITKFLDWLTIFKTNL